LRSRTTGTTGPVRTQTRRPACSTEDPALSERHRTNADARLMNLLLDIIDRSGGIASRRQLLAWGVDPGWIDLAAWYGRHVIRVRHGWFARSGESPEVLRAWRVGGRLTCISALAFHEGAEPGPALHIEVPRNACQLRDPDRRKARLGPEAPVVVHWTRNPGPGTARAVTRDHAVEVAARCGVHGAGVPQLASTRMSRPR